MSKEQLEEIDKCVKHDLVHNDGMMISVNLKQMEWLIEQAKQNERYREALEEIMKIQENHEWNLYGLAYGIAERTLFELEGEE